MCQNLSALFGMSPLIESSEFNFQSPLLFHSLSATIMSLFSRKLIYQFQNERKVYQKKNSLLLQTEREINRHKRRTKSDTFSTWIMELFSGEIDVTTALR
jgi:hypothetical protein